VQTTSAEAEGRSVTVVADDSCRVVGDELLITQALVNLLENALKYSRPGGAVRLAATASGETVEIQVEDEGPGIPEADLPHVFERHFRSGEVRVPGSGLGLTIVKSFVELCGGSVSVDSSPSGTLFRIRLPADTESHVPV
jgi:signal transduction histidine kinase